MHAAPCSAPDGGCIRCAGLECLCDMEPMLCLLSAGENASRGCLPILCPFMALCTKQRMYAQTLRVLTTISDPHKHGSFMQKSLSCGAPRSSLMAQHRCQEIDSR